jgi:hypothetical protein
MSLPHLLSTQVVKLVELFRTTLNNLEALWSDPH